MRPPLAALACWLALPASAAAQGTSPILIDRHMTVGAGAAVAAERPLSRRWFGDTPLTFIVDLAVKTQGYVAGDPIGSGLVARVGIGIPLPR